MTLDAVCAVKVESVAEGGTQNDSTATELSPRQDALTAAGLFVQSPAASVSDKTVLIDRPASSLRFTDNATQRLLSELVTSVPGAVASHEGLRDIQHFLSDAGPGTGFSSGSYCTRNYSGPLLTSEIWWSSASMTTKIFSTTYAYSGGSPAPSTITYVIYSAAGAALKTVTDALTYSGPLCTGVARTWG